MAKLYDEIDDRLARFLHAQRLFFVATAPLAGGHVNVSPKGATETTLRILGPRSVAYLDLTGSGIETLAHLRENARICLMFCAFEGPPKIVRLHGRGEAIGLEEERFAQALAPFEPLTEQERLGMRSVVRVECDRISDSCGYGVPLYDYLGERDTMLRWIENKGRDGILAYQAEQNATSVDGLPGVSAAPSPGA
jgi:predicted pyridoxine 5'-phosphate oxidase superfamily flavin-nucleotide-binding protein